MLSQIDTVTMQWVLVLIILGAMVAIMFRSSYAFVDKAITLTQETEHFQNRSGGGRNGVYDAPEEEYRNYASTMISTPEKIYDRYYARVYERLVNDYKRNLIDYEIEQMVRYTRLAEQGHHRTRILDIGCGTGWHLLKLAKRRYDCVGLDLSRDMLDAAQKTTDRLKRADKKGASPARHGYGQVRLVQGDMTQSDLFGPGAFTHACCFYFTLYYARPATVLRNVHRWLRPGGFFCVHIVDPSRFDPILDAASPIVGISAQNYRASRKTDTKVFFRDRVYHSDFHHDTKTHMATFNETFVHPQRRTVRRHQHHMYMPQLSTLMRTVRRIGFQVRRVSHLVHLGYEHQYLCILQKAV